MSGDLGPRGWTNRPSGPMGLARSVLRAALNRRSVPVRLTEELVAQRFSLRKESVRPDTEHDMTARCFDRRAAP